VSCVQFSNARKDGAERDSVERYGNEWAIVARRTVLDSNQLPSHTPPQLLAELLILPPGGHLGTIMVAASGGVTLLNVVVIIRRKAVGANVF
jgi:hypothetical protein